MKILHMGFHTGCQNDIKYISDKLGFELEYMRFDDGITKDFCIYNVTEKRAQDCWNLYKDYFNSFDCIITSDTAPISRVFLQNNFEKKLIIWICNRFDYHDTREKNRTFPDKKYYDLFKDAYRRKNVKIVGYTPFENYYVNKMKNINIGWEVLKPIGAVSEVYSKFTETNKDNKHKQFYVPVYHNDTQMMCLSKKLNEIGIDNYNSRYNGPMDLVGYKGIIHIPYAWSNLAFFESIHLGLIYFIPSKTFLTKLIKGKNFFWSPPFVESELELSEWYSPENKLFIVYFDSWEDLKNKVKLDYTDKKIKMAEKIKELDDEKLQKWKKLIYD